MLCYIDQPLVHSHDQFPFGLACYLLFHLFIIILWFGWWPLMFCICWLLSALPAFFGFAARTASCSLCARSLAIAFPLRG